MAGHGAADLLQPFLQAQRLAEFGQLVGQIADQPSRVGDAQQRRHLAHHDGAGPEGLDHQAQLGQLAAPVDDALRRRLVQLDHGGDQQYLAGDAGLRQRRFHPLIDQPLMGRMLIDDDQAVGCLRDDVGFVQLRPRSPQGMSTIWSAIGRRRCGGRMQARHVGGARIHRRQFVGRIEGGGLFAEAALRGPVLRPPAIRRRQRPFARAETAEGRQRHGGGSAVAGRRQRVPGGADDQAAHQPGIAKAYLGLGGMNVHIDLFRRQIDEQRHQRVAVAGEEILIGAAHRALQQPVAHRAAIDEQILLRRGRAVQRRQADIARQPHGFAQGIDRQRIVGEIAAHHLGQARQPHRRRVLQQIARGGMAQDGARIVEQREGDFRIGHRQPVDDVGGMIAVRSAPP